MPKKQTILLLSLAAIALLALSACSGGAAPNGNVPNEGNTASSNNSAAANNSPEEQVNQSDNGNENVQPTEEAETEAEEQDEPADAPAEEPAGEISFANDVDPILESRCARCHGIDRIEAELIMLSYDQLMIGGESGPVIIPGDVENSYLAEMILTQKMPKRGPKLTPVQTQTIIDWISQGALNN